MRNVVFILVCLMVFTIAWQEIGVVSGIGTLARLVGYVALGAASLSVLSRFSIRRWPASFYLLGLFLAWSWLSLSWTELGDRSQQGVLTCTALFMFAWMIWEFSPSQKLQLWLLRSFIAGCCVSLVMLLISFIRGDVAQGMMYTRYTGGGLNQNEIAALLVMTIPIVVYLASLPSARIKFLRIAYWAYVPAVALGVFLTGSRTGAICFVFTVTATFVTTVRGAWKTGLMVLCTIACGTVLVVQFVPSSLLQRSSDVMAPGMSGRVEIWSEGLNDFTKSPLVGVGSGAYRSVTMEDRSNLGQVAHNSFIGLLVETGIIGFTIYMAALILIIRSAWRMPKKERRTWLVVLAVWALYSMAISTEYWKATWFLFAVVEAQSAALRNPGLLRAAVRPRWYGGRSFPLAQPK